MKRLLSTVLISCAALAACDDPGAPAPTPDRAPAAGSGSATATAASTASAPAPDTSASATGTTASAPDPSAAPSADAAPSGVASAEPAPSGSSSAAPAAKGFAFPSPKSGILAPADADRLAKPGSASRVRLLDPGAGSLAAVVYTPSKGEAQTLRVELGQKVKAAVQGQPTPKVMSPPQVLDVEVQTEEVDASSGALVTMLLKKLRVDPAEGIDQGTADELTKQLAGLNGYGMRERISPRGETSDAKIQLPPTAPKGAEVFVATMNDVFRAMVPRWPDEAIGTGAKWQVLSREDQGGASVVQLAEYTLKQRAGSKVTVAFTARQLAASENVTLPVGVPPGTTTKLTRFVSTITGSLDLDTAQVAPIKGKQTQDTKISMEVNAPGQAGASPTKLLTDTEMLVTVTIARRAGGAAPSGSSAPAAPATSGAPQAPAPTTTPKTPSP